ncbi:MAG: DUF3857 domain-containing protein [Candidatus Coatesbacteria bacterium]|nr:DUF3857 domain-containing protein [Candidatus Coatesbacteria bacterium]
MLKNLNRGLWLLLILSVGAVSASTLALETAAELPELIELPELDPGDSGPELARTAWSRYLTGARPTELLEIVEGALPTADDASTAALSELAGLIHQGLAHYEEAFSHFGAAVRFDPGRPENLIYLERLRMLSAEFPEGGSRLGALLREVLEDPAQGWEVRSCAARLLAEGLRGGGDPAAASALTREQGYLERFSFLGPFDNENEAGWAEAYGPELDGRVDLAARYPGKRVEVGWRELPRPAFEVDGSELRPFYGTLRLAGVAYPDSQVCGYLVTYVRLDETREVVFNLGAGGAYKLWIDGAEVLADDVYRPWTHPDTAAAGLVLSAGWHEVLIKVCCDVGGWAATLRTTTSAGEALVLEHAPRPPAGWRRPAAPEVSASDGGHYATLEEAAEAGNALACYYLGHLEVIQRRADSDEQRHRELFLRAKQLAAAFPAGIGWAPACYEYGLYETDFNLAREAYLDALDLDPDYVEAYIVLADLYTNLRRPDEVLDHAEAGLAVNPDCLQLLLIKETQLAEREYQLERRAVLDRMLELHPGYLPALDELAAYGANRLSLGERLDIYGSMLEGDAGSDAAVTGIHNLLVARGDIVGALTVLEDYRPLAPFEGWPLRYQSELLFDHGRYTEARAVYDAALELCPDDAEMLARRARCLWELGDHEGAEAAWDRALEIQPNLTWIADYRRALQQGPAGEQFDAPYAVDVYALIDEWEARGPLDPDAAAEYLLDQEIVKVNSDGTSSRVVHRVIKLKRAEALGDFGYGYFNYIPDEETFEVRHMRVIRGDGSELEATDFAEYSNSNVESRMYHDEYTRYAPLPGIEVGAVIDIEYRIDQVGENIYQGNFSDLFVFGNYQPTMRSEFVVITPDDYPLASHVQHGELDFERGEDDGRLVYRWKARELPRIKEEPYAPPLVELLPLVVVSNFTEWDELGRWWWSLSKDSLTPTRAVRELAAELTADDETPFEKLTSIYDYVTSEIRYVALLLGIGGWKPLEPERTLNTGYGDCKATAALLVTLLDSVGIEAYPVLIRTNTRGRLDWEQPAVGLFNHMICAVPFQEGIGPEQLGTRLSLDGEPHFDEYLFLDGVAEYHTWWELPEMDQGCRVYICDPSGGRFARTPLYPPADNLLVSGTRLEIDENGDATGHRELEYGANNAPGRRRDYRQLERQKTNLERYWNNRYPGALVSGIELSDMADMSQSVRFAYDLLLPNLAVTRDDTMSFASHLHLDKLSQSYGTLTERRYPLRLDRRWSQSTTVEFVLPPGYQPLGLPDDVELRAESTAGETLVSYRCSFSFSDGVLRVVDDLVFDAPEVALEDYAEFRAFLAAYDRTQNLILTIQKP